MDLIALKGAIDGIVYIKGALTTLINEKNEMAVRERALDILKSVDSVQAGLFDAREDAFKLQQECYELQQKIRTFEDWKDTERKYQLTNTQGGACVYQSIGEPKHYACPACFAKKTVMPLQELDRGYFNCPSCKSDFTTSVGPPGHVIGNIIR